MSKDNDMLCPWCGGELSGKPGQYVKCRHCGSDIHWGDGKPYKTKFQAAQPNPVVRDVPVTMRPAPTTPTNYYGGHPGCRVTVHKPKPR